MASLELDSPAVAAARKKNSQGFSEEEALALQALLLVPPEEQFIRDIKRLSLLEAEKSSGQKPLTEVNTSKNPNKELWRKGTISDEIARTNLGIENLVTRIPAATKAKTEASQPIEDITDVFYSKLLQLLSSNSRESK